MKEPFAIVTGASRGIGRTIAKGLTEKGYRVAAMARSTDALEELIEEAGGDRITPVRLDMADLRSIETATRQAIEAAGGNVDLLVNNAGRFVHGSIGVDTPSFENLLRINVTGIQKMIQLVLPGMLERKKGTIITVSSLSGERGWANAGVYCAAKAAITNFMDSLYRELAPQGIRACTIAPSWVNTEMAREAGCTLDPADMIQPSDIMAIIDFVQSLSPGAHVPKIVITTRDDLA